MEYQKVDDDFFKVENTTTSISDETRAAFALANILDWLFNGGVRAYRDKAHRGLLTRVFALNYCLGRCRDLNQRQAALAAGLSPGAFRREVMDFRARFAFACRNGHTSKPRDKAGLRRAKAPPIKESLT